MTRVPSDAAQPAFAGPVRKILDEGRFVARRACGGRIGIDAPVATKKRPGAP